jgi:antitoxin component YwqK of YwqJK toxin-antitoxin module
MDFMERLVRSRNKIFIIILIACITGCYSTSIEPSTAFMNLSAADANLKKIVDRIFYNDTLFTGTIYDLYETGDTALVFNFKNGREDGWQEKFYSQNKPAELRFYIAGKKEGVHYAWWQNGQRKFEYHFENDEHNGELFEWYENGNPSRFFHYASGYESGNQRMWWEDGSVRSNYDVKNGKRFGLIGQKLCKNTLNETR